MNKFEKKLRKSGKWIEPGHVNDDGVRVTHCLKPTMHVRVITVCPKCERASVFYLDNYLQGRSKCSFGCFKGRRKEEPKEKPVARKKKKSKYNHAPRESVAKPVLWWEEDE